MRYLSIMSEVKMNKKFWYLTKVSLKKKIGSKWFIATNIILALVILAIININSIVMFFGGDFSENLTIYAVDNAGVYDVFKGTIEALDEDKLLEIKRGESSKEELSKNLKDNEVIVVLNEDDREYLKGEIISNETIDNGLYQIIISSLNSSKSTLGMIKSNVNPEILANVSSPATVERTILSDQGSVDENMTIVMNSVFPTLILPFFMLVVFLVQMVGGEICEEKTTRSMEIIISNVSPKMHLFSKVLASNIFVITQGALLIVFALIGLLINKYVTGTSALGLISSLVGNLDLSILKDKLLVLVPTALILMLLSFLAYAILSGVLASMTVNIEDFNQLQTPVMLISVVGYYLSISASLFNGSTLIHVLSYVPFLSAFLSPTLYIIGEVSLLDIIISIIVMILFIYILLKKGLKVYKNGILNYSTDKVWDRFKKSIKN
ncbi:ABC transporter permease [bacterium]|nr:ABC transporter permease [bacterium]